MSVRFGRAGNAANHDRARELAASRLDEALVASDAVWLEAHLAGCPACRGAAADYEDQHASFRVLRLQAPEPPRDLWARTAASLEAESAHGARGARRSGRRPMRAFPMVPVVGVVVVAVALGAGLLNGRGLFPTGPNAGGPMPTPINVAATNVQVVSRDEAGTVRILNQRIDQVCPMGTAACGVSPSFAILATTSLTGSADLDAIISPSRDGMVVVQRSAGATSVYVLKVSPDVSPVPSGTPTATPAVTATPGVSEAPGTPDPSLGTAAPTVTPEPATVPPVTPDPSATVAPATPDGSPEPGGAGETPTPMPTPTIAVSPASDGALAIAHDVIVVGTNAAYAPDGSRFVFTARPSDGTAGPDVYVWTVGDGEAHAVTADHASVFAGWLDGRLLVSRLVDGRPLTVLVDPADGAETALGDLPTWRPVVGPEGRTAAWWDGTVALAEDGVTPAPGAGRLVLGSWPAAESLQVLQAGSLVDWDVRWDEKGYVVAVWTAARADGAVVTATPDPAETPGATPTPGAAATPEIAASPTAGSLSLYAIDAATGRADLDHPLLDRAKAFAGFALQAGRLVWSAPADGGDTTLQVLAWSGGEVGGRLELPAEQGSSVVR